MISSFYKGIHRWLEQTKMVQSYRKIQSTSVLHPYIMQKFRMKSRPELGDYYKVTGFIKFQIFLYGCAVIKPRAAEFWVVGMKNARIKQPIELVNSGGLVVDNLYPTLWNISCGT